MKIREIQSAFIYFLYWGCRVFAFPLLVFYFVYRCARSPGYRSRFWERWGGLPASFQATASGAIWLHAISVGEVISAAGLLRELRERDSTIPLFVSVGTVGGRAVADERLAGVATGIFYAPIDYPFAVRRVLRRIRPAVVVILETEIWPVLYREVKRAGSSLVIMNGRISDRTLPRYRRFRFLFRHVLRLPDAIFVQSGQDRARYIEAGAPAENIEVLGNLKYDVATVQSDPPKLVVDLLAKLRPSTVWIAASTMPPADRSDVDEDQAVIEAFQELALKYPGLLLILVPRKPDLFDETVHRLRDAGVRYLRRSENKIDPALQLPCVLLLDSMGELAGLFPLADIVFMGGSLARRGGHNLLEPAACGRPIIVGPHMENFAEIAAAFREHYAMLEIENADELAPAVEKLIQDPRLAEDLGTGAAEIAAKRRGVTRKAVAEILRWLDRAVPRAIPAGPAQPLLWVLAQLWTAVSTWSQRRSSSRARHLDTPVVSVGSISMGGAGKTPMVDYLAERMRQRGRRPAILTRGYMRRSIEPSILIEAGEDVPASVTGDEAQIFVHSGYADAGIGADRWSTGRLLEEKYHPHLFLLDDGFQHRRLARDLDIVLIDALNPFAEGAVFPLGRLREPLRALARADAFVLMRAAPEREYRGIRDRLLALNPKAPIFRGRIEPRYWVHTRTGQPAHPPDAPAAAFCGLANPASFWKTLRALGIDPVFTWTFDDHHRYQCTEVQRLAAQARMHGAPVLLTTEKDAMNLPERAAEILLDASMELYWLKIGIQVEREEALLDLIESKLASARGSVSLAEPQP
jgi:3-deoxy-D-manno-octulosonic-acid transferase